MWNGDVLSALILMPLKLEAILRPSSTFYGSRTVAAKSDDLLLIKKNLFFYLFYNL